jgi:hypothetical protein
MRGSLPPLPNTPSWRGAQLKDRDNFTFYLYLTLKKDNNKMYLRVIECEVIEWIYPAQNGDCNNLSLKMEISKRGSQGSLLLKESFNHLTIV